MPATICFQGNWRWRRPPRRSTPSKAKAAEDHRETLRRRRPRRRRTVWPGDQACPRGRKGAAIRLHHRQEVADALEKQHGIKVEKRRVELSEPIRAVGEYEASVWLYAGITIPMRVLVTAEA